MSSERQLLVHMPTSTARSTPAASITAIVSATNSVSAYASAVCGRSDRPLPRGSMVTTFERRAR